MGRSCWRVGIGNIRADHVQKGDVVGAKLIALAARDEYRPRRRGGFFTVSASLRDLDFASVQRDNPEMETPLPEVTPDRCCS